MNIYIPSYLRKINLINQVCRLIEEYGNYYEIPVDSFDDYHYSLKNDPVKRFLSEYIRRDKDQDNESIINYLSRLFYSVKGTIKVFEYMRKYLNLEFEGDIIYTTRYLEIKLTRTKVTDEATFYNNLVEFLNALVYYQELRLIIGTTELVIDDNINNYIGYNITNYNKFTVEPYEISN